MEINGRTVLHGIMGNPVSHSLSPVMHNSAFAAVGLNAVYVPFPVIDVAPALTGFRAIGVRGVSVTIPHKQAVIPLLDAIDPVAAKIGAVNTLLIDNNRIIGYNTDWLGANRALEEKISLAGCRVLLLGAGGSARAIGFGLIEAGARVVIVSRTAASGRELAAGLGCPWHPLEELPGLTADCLINATSVGMTPHSETSLVPRQLLPGLQVVMDIVYAPLQTRLLREADEAGCRTVDGTAMLLYQGVAQFELWTGKPAPVDVMRHSLLAALAVR
ncbi:MAG: shikimate dehydrogenase [Thermodesulfobacteriota bacterium]